MKKKLITNATLINEGRRYEADLLISNGRIEKIGGAISDSNAEVFDASGLWLLPGVIDDQVHFREPGLTHKADIGSESRAAVAGGVTSFMEMPNTKPPALTQELLEDKYRIAARTSPANYSFFMGCSNDNLKEVLKTDPRSVCGIKIFMGSSTGNMLVDDERTLENVFSQCKMLIALHCEDEGTIIRNTELAIQKYGDNIPMELHPDIRSREACYLSSSKAVALAKKYGTRIHVLHLTTAEELDLFRNDIPLREKHITAEVCVHHLSFNASDYADLGSKIKCNPAIKLASDQEALWKALNDDRLDVVATDHAPHTSSEKAGSYLQAPSGLPLIQHTLQIMIDHAFDGRISMEKLVHKMCHAPAELFRIRERGYLREGYWADLVLVDPSRPHTVLPSNLLYKCGWSPFEGRTFRSSIAQTFVSGNCVFKDGVIKDVPSGMRLEFEVGGR
ncbi:MAG: dihydroorotase [Flavobacteriales bacterium]|nr:dihydroorotase [Flavobacteriales bacterium]